MRIAHRVIVATACCCFSSATFAQQIEFNRHIRPLLSDKCFSCHGPDANQRQAKLRLDHAPDVKKRIVLPKQPTASELFRRITSDDPNEIMPPPDSGHTLSANEIALIKRWIQQGGAWQKHWSLLPPIARNLPNVKKPEWPRGPIDAHVLSRLEREQLPSSPPADRRTMLRRATLTLTGLPPTLDETEQFLRDREPGAYERLVDRLLASPAYGERMASLWLDAARYADTSGYQNDGPRDMWRWRDWVIEAYNRNQPFDEFSVEQLAGDLLPKPTLSQRIATGFNRNHRGNAEGGIIPEEYQVEYVVDRVDTTGTVWLGLTLGCARCHDHKFDPISQREFYSLFAYFNQVPEHGRAIKEGNSPPFIQAPTEAQSRKLAQLDSKLRDASQRWQALQAQLQNAQQEWEQSLAEKQRKRLPANWTLTHGQVLHIDPTERESKKWKAEGGELERASDWLRPAAAFDGSSHIDAGNEAKFGYFDKFSFSVWLRAEKSTGTVLSKNADTARAGGYAVELRDGKLQVNLVKRWLDDAIRVESQRPIPLRKWTHIAVTYDGSRVAKGIEVYVNGDRQPLAVNLDAINQSFESDDPFRVGAGSGPEQRFQGAIADVRVFKRVLPPPDVRILATPNALATILERAERSPQESAKLTRYFVTHHAPAAMKLAWRNLRDLRDERTKFFESLPTVMVMQDVPGLRQTHVLQRGEYDKPGEAVTRTLPAALRQGDRMPTNRLQLAEWIVDRKNPLTARVIVNRVWQMHFGVGLVKTTEDFGSQGEQPSHPDLLDWLAIDFQRDWDVKRLHRQIVTSATYRQSSRVRPRQLERDPENRLLSRGPRFRLRAGMVRDQALASAGLLVRRLGGESVKPYQPKGLWKEIATGGAYPQDHGDKLYRRSVYTYRKRTVAPPVMAAFDASSRETCIVRPTRTNTPLQALALLNETGFVEAARKLAERVMHRSANVEQQVEDAYRIVLARPPTDAERAVLTRAFARYASRYQASPAAVKQLLGTGESTSDASFDQPAFAAMTMVASLILNLDEAVNLE